MISARWIYDHDAGQWVPFVPVPATSFDTHVPAVTPQMKEADRG